MKHFDHLSGKLLILTAAVIFVLTVGAFLTAYGTDPVQTQETTMPTVPVSDAYAKILAIEDAEQYDPAVLEAFAQRLGEEENFLEIYTENWTLKQDGTRIRLTCVAPLTDDYKRSTFKLIHDGKNLYVDAFTKEEYPDAYTKDIHMILRSAEGWNESSDRVRKDFLEFLLACDWFPDSSELEQYKTNWYYQWVPLPEGDEDERYLTLFIEFREAGSAPDEPYILRSVYHDGNVARDRSVEEIDLFVEVTVPPTTEPVPTEPAVPFDYENSLAYQKLQTLPNAEDFLCNRFGYNELAIFAEWIDSQEGLMETYPEWYVVKYADGGAGFFCHTPPAEDNSCDYMIMYMYDYHSLYSGPYIGRRYLTDIPREEISDLICGAYDPIGVEDWLKERMIDQALVDECFAWNVMDPAFRIMSSYYEIHTYWPYPEYEPDNYDEDITLAFHVWRPGMAEGDYIKCWLGYDEELNRVYYSSDSPEEGFLSAYIPSN